VAFLLVPLVLGYLALLGIACVCAFGRRVPTALVLTSPASGAGVLVALELTLNRLGLPVASFALALALGMGVAAAAVVAWRRPQIAWDELRPLAFPVLAGCLLAGAPIMVFGFDWAGNANPDMALYTNSAASFLRHGFFDVPDVGTLRANTDAARNAWFWEVLPPNRYGADALVALAAAVFRVPVYEIYMVLEVASFGALVTATAALVLDRGSRLRTYASAALIAVASPLMLYVIFQQLLPQILGQVAMVALVALVQTRSDDPVATRQRGVALGCVLVALLFYYPEISSVVALGAVVTAPFVLWAHRHALRDLLSAEAPVTGIALVTVLVLLNAGIFTVVATLQTLSTIGANVAAEQIGPITYYLIPSGLANLWGFAPFDGYLEPWLSIGIVAGFLAFAGVLAASVRALPRGRLADGMTVATMALLLYLFARRSGYGSFKIAFLLQPFLAVFAASALVAACDFLRRRLRFDLRWSVPAALTLAIGLTAYSTLQYLGATADVFRTADAKFTELHAASTHRLYAQLDRIAGEYRAMASAAHFISDAPLPNLAQIEGIAFVGHPLTFAAMDPYSYWYGSVHRPRTPAIVGWPAGSRARAIANGYERRALFEWRTLSLGGARVDASVAPPMAPRADDVLIETGPNLTILNRSTAPPGFDVRAVPLRGVRNRLALVDSELGPVPLKKLRTSAIGPVEPDPFARTETVATVGTSMLLEVMNGDPAIRLRLDVTGTLNPEHVDDLPPITVEGTSAVKLTDLGSGAARLLTPPIRPFEALGHRYVVVRFGRPPLHFLAHRSWIMALFGRDIDLQPRTFTLYGRDISIVRTVPPSPSYITTFPHDLLDRALLFSGIYEDGWMSNAVHVRLKSAEHALFRLRANVPPGQLEHTITVSIDGRVVKEFIARASTDVVVQVPSPGVGDHDVSIVASSVSPLSADDPREIWGGVEELGFRADVDGTGVRMTDERQWYPLETYDNRTFRWTKGAVHLRLVPSRVPRVLRLAVAPGPSAGGNVDVAVSVAGRVEHVHVDRERTIDVAVPSAAKPLDVAVTRPSGHIAAPNDPRDLTLRVFSATLSAAGAGR
jgi:hypothetical protein